MKVKNIQAIRAGGQDFVVDEARHLVPGASNPALSHCGVVLVLPENVNEVSAKLTDTHTGFPRSLRTNVAVTLYLRNDLWKQWIEE